MCWFCGKPKTPLQLMEEELKRQHSRLGDAFTRSEAEEQIEKINAVIRNAAALQLNQKLETRLQAIEDSVADLYLTGRDDGAQSSKG